MAHEVIMPALGMAQSTGQIVSWLKAEGDPVKVGDALMEVETDKATMEVEAQAEGYLVELRYAAGVDVPVGDVVALIGAAPAEGAVGVPAATPVAQVPQVTIPNAEKSLNASARQRVDAPPAFAPAPGRILASPKAKRAAAARGIELEQLVSAGLPQPFHVADVEGLVPAKPASLPVAAPVDSRSEYQATVLRRPVLELASWIGDKMGTTPDIGGIWAAFAGASLGVKKACIRVETLHDVLDYEIAPHQRLSTLVATQNAPAPDLIVRDLFDTLLSGARIESDLVPSLTMVAGPLPDTIVVTLRVSDARLAPGAAMRFLEAFLRRVEDPLRHLV